MVCTHARFRFVLYSDVFPTERCLVYVQTPDIIDGLRACVPSENEQVGLAEHDSVTVATTRGASNHGNDHPLRCRVAIPQIEQIQVI